MLGRVSNIDENIGVIGADDETVHTSGIIRNSIKYRHRDAVHISRQVNGEFVHHLIERN